MKIIAFEEHYKTPAIARANKNHPAEQVYAEWQKVGRWLGDPALGVPPGIYDLGDKRIAAMDAAGIDVQILSHTVPGPEELEPKLAIDLASQANDAASAAVSKYPDRFRAFATLPMRDPKAAAQELERSVRKLGFVGALINGHVNGRYLDDKFFWPVFECAESLNVPIYLHPNRAPQPVVSAYYGGSNLSYPAFSRRLVLVGMSTREFMPCD
jgi:predicted TIM-barrel fold metal-dependent hydrolase